MAGKVKKSSNKKSLLIASVLMLLIIGLPLVAAVSQKYQNSSQVLAGTSAAVSIIDFQFNPASITVAAGTTVTWTNMSASGSDHTTTSDSQTGAEHWDSGLTNPTGAGGLPQTFSHTFTTPGTYTYHCNVHTFMRGTVVVTAAGTAPTATTAPAAPTATMVPATIAPTAITPTLVCVGGNGTPPCATIPPTQSMVTGTPTAVPTLNITQPTQAPSGGGSGNQNAIQLLIQFILLILQFLQKLI
jgi:plastocyanin